MNCPNCHAELDAGSKFCPSCGSPVMPAGQSAGRTQPVAAQDRQPVMAPYSEPAPKKKKSKLPIAICGLLATAALASVALINPGRILPWDPVINLAPQEQPASEPAPADQAQAEASKVDSTPVAQTEGQGSQAPAAESSDSATATAPESNAEADAARPGSAPNQSADAKQDEKAGDWAFLLGAWRGELTSTGNNIKCYGDDEHPIQIDIKSVNATSGRVDADVTVLAHAHRAASSTEASNPADTVVEIKDAVLSLSNYNSHLKQMTLSHEIEEGGFTVQISVVFYVPNPDEDSYDVTADVEQTVREDGTLRETYKRSFTLNKV